MMLRIIAVLAACALLVGCDDGDRKRDAENAKKVEDSERVKKRLAGEREAEERLFRDDPGTMIGNRLSQWITAQDGLYILPAGMKNATFGAQDKIDGVVAMPITTPWFANCGSDGASVSIGPWSENIGRGDDMQQEPKFGILLIALQLNPQQCRAVVVTAGQWMNRLTGK